MHFLPVLNLPGLQLFGTPSVLMGGITSSCTASCLSLSNLSERLRQQVPLFLETWIKATQDPLGSLAGPDSALFRNPW